MGTWVHLLEYASLFTFISSCARETERKKRPTPTKFSDENGYTGIVVTYTKHQADALPVAKHAGAPWGRDSP